MTRTVTLGGLRWPQQINSHSSSVDRHTGRTDYVDCIGHLPQSNNSDARTELIRDRLCYGTVSGFGLKTHGTDMLTASDSLPQWDNTDGRIRTVSSLGLDSQSWGHDTRRNGATPMHGTAWCYHCAAPLVNSH